MTRSLEAVLKTLRVVLVIVACAAGCVSSNPAVEASAARPQSSVVATPSTERAATPEPDVQDANPVPTVPAAPLPAERANPLGLDAYQGLGAWIDVFDWAPAYASSAGPAVTPGELANMADLGVTTLYMQTSRLDDTGSGLIESPEVVGQFLTAAAEHDIAMVGWYLPRWEDAAEDLARLVAIDEFEMNGLRFDGVAVDIEGVPDVTQRADWNLRLVELSRDLKAEIGPRAVGAIVLPPTLIEVVNTEYWPDFPWTEIAPFYDVWLPMSYWSFRSDDSPFANGYSYNADSTDRLRVNLADPDAVVHSIGGIGAIIQATEATASEPLAAVDELDDFVRSLLDTGAIGGSIYDWASMDPSGRTAMTNAMRQAGLTAE